jgi:hypothetical protein
VPEEHAVPPRRVPAEAVWVAHSVGVDLAERARPAHEGIDGRNPVLAVDAVPRPRVDPKDLSVRHRQVLGLVIPDPQAAVAHRDVEQTVVLVAALGGGVEVDLLDAVDLAAESEPEDLPAGSLEGAGRRIVRRPLGHDAVVESVPLGRHVRGLRRAGRQLGVNRVEPAVLPELGAERHESEALPHASAGEELGCERGAHVEVDVRRAALVEQIHLAVEVGHELASGTVRNLADVVDPGLAHQPRIDRRRDRLRLGERGELFDGQPQTGRDRILRNRIGDRFVNVRDHLPHGQSGCLWHVEKAYEDGDACQQEPFVFPHLAHLTVEKSARKALPRKYETITTPSMTYFTDTETISRERP